MIYTAEGDRIQALPKTRGRHETELYGLVRQISKDRFVPDQFKLHVNKTLRRRFTRANPRTGESHIFKVLEKISSILCLSVGLETVT